MKYPAVLREILFASGVIILTVVVLHMQKEDPRLVFALLALPIAVVVVIPALRRPQPTALFALFVLAQPLTAFAIQTPVASITVDNLILILLILAYVITRPQPRSHNYHLVLISLVIWWASHLLRINYLSPGEIAREMITSGSLILIFVITARLPIGIRTLNIVALASLTSLLVFCGAALLAANGISVAPGSSPPNPGNSRELFGITSPWPRTYGLPVAIDAIAFLMPLCTPILAYRLFAPHVRVLHRMQGFTGLSILGLASLYLFQARGMILGIVIASIIILWITRPSIRIILVPSLGASAFWLAAPAIAALLSADLVSSGLRTANILGPLKMVAADPLSFAFGRDESAVFYELADQVGLARAIGGEGDDAIHNAFLSQLVGGGWISFLSFAFPFTFMMFTIIKRIKENSQDAPTVILFCAATVVLLEMLVETGRAQVVGNWIVLGLVFTASRPNIQDMAPKHTEMYGTSASGSS